MRRLRPIAVVLAVAALTVPAAVFATADRRDTAAPKQRADSATAVLVKKLSTTQFGNVLALRLVAGQKAGPGPRLVEIDAGSDGDRGGAIPRGKGAPRHVRLQG